jgi:ABC-type Fe3+/spermidine/putrescine transport system ATPase subunit
LSGGQRQRELARALILRRASCWMSLWGADPACASRQITLNKSRKKVGITFIHVTHDQKRVEIPDRVAIVHRGALHRWTSRARCLPARNRFTAGHARNNMIGGRITAINLNRSAELPGAVASAVLGGRPGRRRGVIIIRPERSSWALAAGAANRSRQQCAAGLRARRKDAGGAEGPSLS